MTKLLSHFLIALSAAAAAVVTVVLASARLRNLKKDVQPVPQEELDPQKADEITSTWTLLH